MNTTLTPALFLPGDHPPSGKGLGTLSLRGGPVLAAALGRLEETRAWAPLRFPVQVSPGSLEEGACPPGWPWVQGQSHSSLGLTLARRLSAFVTLEFPIG